MSNNWGIIASSIKIISLYVLPVTGIAALMFPSWVIDFRKRFVVSAVLLFFITFVTQISMIFFIAFFSGLDTEFENAMGKANGFGAISLVLFFFLICITSLYRQYKQYQTTDYISLSTTVYAGLNLSVFFYWLLMNVLEMMYGV